MPAKFRRFVTRTALQANCLCGQTFGKLRPDFRVIGSSPAFGLYQREAEAGVYQLFGLVVLGVVGEQIGSLVAFLELSSLSSFALPPTLPSSSRSTTIDSDFTVPSNLHFSQGRSIDDASA